VQSSLHEPCASDLWKAAQYELHYSEESHNSCSTEGMLTPLIILHVCLHLKLIKYDRLQIPRYNFPYDSTPTSPNILRDVRCTHLPFSYALKWNAKLTFTRDCQLRKMPSAWPGLRSSMKDYPKDPCLRSNPEVY
jgi:hypothetical protein